MMIRMRIRQEAWMRSRLLRKRLGKERVRPSPLPDACEEAREEGAKIKARFVEARGGAPVKWGDAQATRQ